MTSNQEMHDNYLLCPRCGFKRVAKYGTYRMESKHGMSLLIVDAYICDNCGHLEFYKPK
jgi:DNA-directed RNA polymerase subunit RPC12/RpoP